MLSTAFIVSCSGKDGRDGIGCAQKENGDGTVTLTCGENSFVIQGGKNGEDGEDCYFEQDDDGPIRIICGDDELVIPICGNGKYNPTTKGCEADLSKLTEEELKVFLRMQNPKNRIGVDEAVEQANWVIDFLNEEGDGPSRNVKSVSALASDDIEFAEALKANGIEVPDTLIYVVNFDNDLGFAIISADDRIDGSILAFTGNGSLTDSIDNPGVAIFLDHLEDYMLNSIIEAERQKDSLIGGIMEKLDVGTGTKASFGFNVPFDPSIMTKYTITRNKIDPLVLVEWGQGAPFNDSLKYKDCKDNEGNIKNNGKVLAGCAAVAVAHIMSYWGHPNKIGDYSFSWNLLNETTGNDKPPSYPKAAQIHIDNALPIIKNQIANLMKLIGNGVSMDYGCGGSSANKFIMLNFLLSNGFSLQLVPSPRIHSPMLISYNSKTAIASMNKREPLMMYGCPKQKKSFWGLRKTFYDCHFWVIDGYLERQTTVLLNSYDYVIVDRYTNDYIHNNWGWNGDRNGYYKSGVFNSNTGPDFLSDGTTKSGEAYNYQYEIQMTPYIRR
jgi:hypothetical protein